MAPEAARQKQPIVINKERGEGENPAFVPGFFYGFYKCICAL